MWINRPAYTVLLAGEDIANWKGTAMKFDVKLKKTIGNREVSDCDKGIEAARQALKN